MLDDTLDTLQPIIEEGFQFLEHLFPGLMGQKPAENSSFRDISPFLRGLFQDGMQSGVGELENLFNQTFNLFDQTTARPQRFKYPSPYDYSFNRRKKSEDDHLDL